MSGRRAVARPTAAGDLMDAVVDYERSDLPERAKVALRLARAYLAHPGVFGLDARAETLEHFSPAQAVELLLKLTAWTVDKSLTALDLDEPIDPDGLTEFHYDETGALAHDG